ncbi:MAG: glycoside hydrolase, partial [Candidatus Altiarchaeota archaeon]
MKKFKLFVVLVLMALVASNVSASPGFVSRSGTNFYLDGMPFYYAGTNNYYLWYKSINCSESNPPASEGCVVDVLDDARELNLTVVRTWGFGDGAAHDGYAFQPSPGVYDESTFAHFD